MNLGIKNKIALVFGAGSGLGQAIAISLAKEGAKVVLAGRTPEKLEATAKEIESFGGECLPLTWNLATPSDIEKNFALIEKSWGGVDILVNNTGGPPATPVVGQTPSLWLEKFQEMILSVISITDRALPRMKDKQWGRIITSTSSGAISPITNLGISNTLRASLHAWSKTLSKEVAPYGITANILVPGRIATDRIRSLDEIFAERENKTVEEIKLESLKMIPIGRLGKTEEYGDTAAFLASQQAAYITGTITRVDGGLINSI